MNKRNLTFLATCLLSPFLISPVYAETTFAMVVGINKYSYEKDLDGAVNDATDIEGALKDSGVNNIRKFVNDGATKQHIKARWNEMVRLSKKGDTLIVSFAGHGMQLPDGSGDEADKKDEAFALKHFKTDSIRGNKDNYILDDEWNTWFRQAPGRKIIFVADTCHSGTIDKSILRKVFKQRWTPTSHAHKSEPAIDNQIPSSKPLSNLLTLAATIANKTVSEVDINGVRRGALSWAFANGMRGKADKNDDGRISRKELATYVRIAVQRHSKGQTPQFSPRNAFNSEQPMFASAGKVAANQKQLNIGLFRMGGEHVNFATTGNTYPYLTLYNITQNGAVQFLYPQGADEIKQRVRDVFNLKLRVDRAFTGNEKIVAIYSVQPQQQLHQLLQQLHNKSGGIRQLNTQKTHLLKGQYEEKSEKHYIKR